MAWLPAHAATCQPAAATGKPRRNSQTGSRCVSGSLSYSRTGANAPGIPPRGVSILTRDGARECADANATDAVPTTPPAPGLRLQAKRAQLQLHSSQCLIQN